MGFHGVASKGCERCRERKVKCDLRRPSCSRCSKLTEVCPGYRDLSDVIFRNENSRISSKRRERSPRSLRHAESSLANLVNGFNTIPSTLGQQMEHLGHEFFFTTYSSSSTPFCRKYQDWLKQHCISNDNAVADAVNAVGLAGLANVSGAPQMKMQANGAHEKVNKKLTKMLQSPNQRLTDETLLVVIILCLYQIVSFESRQSYLLWTQLVNQALELVDERGSKQFDGDRGGQLYVQMRTPVLCVCIQQHQEVPPALVNATYVFENADLRQRWRDTDHASPASMSVISFRLVNLRAAVKRGYITDWNKIQTLATAVDEDLMAWKDALPRHWNCITLGPLPQGQSIDKKQHHYPNTWLAEVWNTWRILRIACYQIISQAGMRIDEAVEIIRQMSEEICCSVSAFNNNPRATSLIRHLCVVGLEGSNPTTLRMFAAQQLQSIGKRMGVQHATQIANLILEHLENGNKTGWFDRLDCDAVPLAAPF